MSTPIPTILEMEWIDILEWYREAYELQRAEVMFQARLAGARFK